MITRKIRRNLKKVVRQLGLGDHSDMHSIQTRLEAIRDRPITIMELPTMNKGDVSGFWAYYENQDVIVHAPPQSTMQLQQIVLHEFAHMLLDHEHAAVSLSLPLLQLPGIPGTPLMTLERTNFEDQDEASAEYLADLLAATMQNQPVDPPTDPTGFTKVFG
ncbi:hypothetical protein AAGW05_13685 [Arthrobacter sp. LAPM80]|uniref:hypothetical protein n=1 Tax=Arthrobacter sp. LAPM80 TaxID=3141788 RepID=UPI00398A5BD6